MPNLVSFKIQGCNRAKDIEIHIHNNMKILVSDNGAGKTTILKALYYVMSFQISKLLEILFERIFLAFDDGSVVYIDRHDLILSEVLHKSKSVSERLYTLASSRARTKEIFSMISEEIKDKPMHKDVLIDVICKKTDIRKRSIELAIQEYTDIVQALFEDSSASVANDLLQLVLNEKNNTPRNLRHIKRKRFSSYFDVDYNHIYLPTWRLVEKTLYEEDSDSISYEKSPEILISFGLKDMRVKIQELSEVIRKSTLAGFNEVTRDMLNFLYKMPEVDLLKKDKVLNNKDIVEIILARTSADQDGMIISNDKIIKIFDDSRSFFDKKYDSLIFMLFNLIEMYEKNKDIDEALQNFTEVCNNYLRRKSIVYDKKLISINVISESNEIIDFEDLSSGEKQVLSIFSKIYLNLSKKPSAIFIDEPELSLGIRWQKRLISDILNSGKCGFLLVATHSPFIFSEAELRSYVSDLDEDSSNISLDN